MTISVVSELVYSSQGDGVTTEFTYPVRFEEASELVVISREDGVDTVLTLNTDYTVAGAGLDAGGTVTTLYVPAATEEIVRYRDTAAKQIVNLADSTRNPAEAVENQLDRFAMNAQDQSERLSRAVLARPGSTGQTLPEPEADKIIMWNTDGDGLINRTVGEQGELVPGVNTGDLISTNNGSDFADPLTTLANLSGALQFADKSDAALATIPVLTTLVTVGDAVYREALNATDYNAFPDAVRFTDAGGRQFVIAGGKLTFRMFGAKGDRNLTDDTAAINLALDTLRAMRFDAVNFFPAYVDGEGLLYRADGSLNFTNLKGRAAGLYDFGIYSFAEDKIAIDCVGSENLDIDNCFVIGAASAPPAVGILFARIDDGGPIPFPTAQKNSIGFFEFSGTFKKAGFMNLASEVMDIKVLQGFNNYHSPLATCSLFVGHTDVAANFCGLPVSEFQPIGLGSQSLANVNILQHNVQRGPAYGYSITSISKANPAVVTIAAADAAEGNASFGLVNGSTIFLDSIIGSDPDWQQTLGYKVFTVANLDTVAGTFELVGVDTSGLAGTFTSGILRNDTGPSTVLGQIALYKEGGGYQVVYSDAHYRLDTRGDPDWNWGPIVLSGRHETASDHLLKVIGDGVPRIVRNLRVESDNSATRASPIAIAGVTGAGDITFTNLEVVLGHPAQTPTVGLFDNPGVVNLYSGHVAVPSVDFIHPAQALKFSTARWSYGSNERIDGNPEFHANGPSAAAATATLTDDTAAAGPYFDVHRESASPAVGDIMGYLRFTGKNSAGNAIAYAGLRARLNDPTSGSEDARLQVLNRIAGVETESHYFDGASFRYVSTMTVAQLPAGSPVGSTVYVPNMRVFNGAGTLEGAGAGTGGLATKTSAGWVITGTNVLAQA